MAEFATEIRRGLLLWVSDGKREADYCALRFVGIVATDLEANDPSGV